MQLLELVGVKKYYDKNLDGIVDLFAQKHKVIGGGMFSIVFDADADTIYKFWIKDPGYEKFVNYCIKNKSNPYLPKFKSPIKTISTFFERPADFPDKIKYIKMEKLSPYTDEHRIGISDWDKMVQLIADVMYINDFDVDQTMDFIKTESPRGRKCSPEELKEVRKVARILFDLGKLVSNPANDIDLHRGNFMFRSNQFVIIDPIAEVSDRHYMEELYGYIDDKSIKRTSGRTKR